MPTTLEPTARDMSLAIEGVAKTLAQWAVVRQGELDPTLAERFGDRWRTEWVADTHMRVRQLAQAVAVRSPSLFGEAAAWSAAAFTARDMGLEDLQRNLDCLEEVIGEQLPDAVSEAAGRHLAEARRRVSEAPGEPGPGSPARPLEELALLYMEAVFSGRRRDAEQLILDAVDAGRPVRELYSQVLAPVQVEIGRLWHANELSVTEEHLATFVCESLMSRLRSKVQFAAPNGKRLIAAAVSGELHDLGVRMVAEFFEMGGWETIYLGANVPNADLVRGAAEFEVDLLAVSVSSVLNLRRCGDLVEQVRAAPELGHLKVIVGGAPFRLAPDLWRELGADGVADSAEGAVALGDRLVPRPAARRGPR